MGTSHLFARCWINLDWAEPAHDPMTVHLLSETAGMVQREPDMRCFPAQTPLTLIGGLLTGWRRQTDGHPVKCNYAQKHLRLTGQVVLRTYSRKLLSRPQYFSSLWAYIVAMSPPAFPYGGKLSGCWNDWPWLEIRVWGTDRVRL